MCFFLARVREERERERELVPLSERIGEMEMMGELRWYVSVLGIRVFVIAWGSRACA